MLKNFYTIKRQTPVSLDFVNGTYILPTSILSLSSAELETGLKATNACIGKVLTANTAGIRPRLQSDEKTPPEPGYRHDHPPAMMLNFAEDDERTLTLTPPRASII